MLRRSASVLLLTAAVLQVPSTAEASHATDGAVAREWAAVARQTVQETNAIDAAAARTYAMVDAAVFDAVNGLAKHKGRYPEALVAPQESAKGDPEAAASQAAHDVLVGLYPTRAATYDAVLADDLAAISPPVQARHGAAWGAEVARGVLAARAHDGSEGNETQAGGTGPGVFTGSWSQVQYRNLRPFVIADPAQYAVDSRPPLDSPAYAEAWDEVRRLGSAATTVPGAKETFQFWSLGARSVQPPGAWQQVASTLSENNGLPLLETARLLALQAMAMADTVGPTFTVKHDAHAWRPTTAIQQAGTDSNPLTTAEPTWAPRGGSVGGTPEHWSGHSSFSAAGARALALLLSGDDQPFDLTIDGVTRHYASLSDAAAEAGRSRILGGLHFPFSNAAGLAAGRAIAEEVVSRR